jgi:hypothetical protein
VEQVKLEDGSAIYRLGQRLYEADNPFGVPFDKLSESERWPWYGTAEGLITIIEAAGYVLVEGTKGENSDSERSGGRGSAPTEG